MMSVSSPCKIRGWILDAYPSNEGEITIWIISESGQRIRITDNFHPKIYVSSKQDNIEPLIGKLYNNPDVIKWDFAYKFARPTDSQKSKVLELALRDCRRTQTLTNNILRLGDYIRYQVSNCDLKGDRAYFFSHDIFPLALLEVKVAKTGLQYTLRDSVSSTDYSIPPLRVMKLDVKIAKKSKIADFSDPIGIIELSQDEEEIQIGSADEAENLLQLVKTVKELDPDFLVTSGGDSHLFPYLTERATINNVIDKFTLSRDGVVKKYRQKLLDGEVPIGDLIISKRMSRKPERYRQHVSQVIAAEQLIKEGAEVHAGTSIKFLFTHSKDKRHERRVKAAQLIDEEINPDCKKYLFLLYSSAANLLSFAGYTIKSICETVTGHDQKNLADYWKKGDEMQPSNSSKK